jgi:hypothetical protein
VYHYVDGQLVAPTGSQLVAPISSYTAGDESSYKTEVGAAGAWFGRYDSTLEDGICSHACLLEANTLCDLIAGVHHLTINSRCPPSYHNRRGNNEVTYIPRSDFTI